MEKGKQKHTPKYAQILKKLENIFRKKMKNGKKIQKKNKKK